MNFKKNIIFLFLYFNLHCPLQAQSSLTISVINSSNITFAFTHTQTEFPNSVLAFDRYILKPGDTGLIVGVDGPDYDLAGSVYFEDGAQFIVLDRRQFKFGQPIFSMKANSILSKVLSRTFNPVTGPRLLSFTAATVEITDGEHEY